MNITMDFTFDVTLYREKYVKKEILGEANARSSPPEHATAPFLIGSQSSERRDAGVEALDDGKSPTEGHFTRC